MSAVPAPHEGTSYNPSVDSHLTLLRSAHEAEEKRVKDAEQLKGLKDKIIEARRVAEELDNGDSVPGMQVDIPQADAADESSEEGDEERPVKKAPERKTKKERLKAAKRRAEVSIRSRVLFIHRTQDFLRESRRKEPLRRNSLKSDCSIPSLWQNQ